MYPLTFEDIYYELALTCGSIIQQACLFLCTVLYICTHDNRKSSALILMGIYSLYSVICDVLFNEVTTIFYFLESLSFFGWAIIIMSRPEFKTPKTINNNNILLAFYKGGKGSFIMRFFELFGLPVKSMCIIAGDGVLNLKLNKKTFEYSSSKNIYKNKNDYVIVDTGVKYTDSYIVSMKEFKDFPARKNGLRIRCIEGIAPLLSLIGEKWKPSFIDNIPSIYLRKCIAI